MEDNKNIYNKSHFSKNVKYLFNKESQNFYNKHRLNLKLKSLINKEKSLNNRKIIDFNYSRIFHRFKVNMKKFDDVQQKRKIFFKTLCEENTKFNKEYHKNYSSNVDIRPKHTKTNITSKTFQKFYDKHQIMDTSKQVNNLFKRDPLLVSNNDIKLFYMSKEEKEDEFDDEALHYVNKLENNINQKSVLNKVRNALFHNKKREKGNKISLNKEKDFPYIESYKDTDTKKELKNLKNEFLFKNYFKKYSMDMKKYNRNIMKMISKLNKTNDDFKFKKKQLSFDSKKENNNYKQYNNQKRSKNSININDLEIDNLKTNYYSSKTYNTNQKKVNINKWGENKKEKKSSNQIESLYNELFKIKKTISKYEKKNENEIKYLYAMYSNNSVKKFKQSFIENQRLLKLDKELVYSVNSFND